LILASIPVPRETAVQECRPAWEVLDLSERAAALLLSAVVFPVTLASALVLALLSRRTPLIAHRRVGWCGSTLWMLKLRTMWDESSRPAAGGGWVEYINDDSGPQRKQDGDSRVPNWFARFCRRHSIDEFPQLWHVVRGEMALVGPRPITASEMRRYYGEDAGEVLQVKPGIAGLWQVSGRSRLTYSERRALDLRFVRHRSPAMYWRILVRSIAEVCSGSNSW
jgi:exopolysaccharide production protein ExoY